MSFMDNFTQTEHGLLRKRERILSEIALIERNLNELRGNLITIDNALVLFGHKDLPLKGPKPYLRMFKRNELKRLLISIYREKPELTMMTEISREIIKRKGWDETNEKVYKMVYRRVKEARRYCKPDMFYIQNNRLK